MRLDNLSDPRVQRRFAGYSEADRASLHEAADELGHEQLKACQGFTFGMSGNARATWFGNASEATILEIVLPLYRLILSNAAWGQTLIPEHAGTVELIHSTFKILGIRDAETLDDYEARLDTWAAAKTDIILPFLKEMQARPTLGMGAVAYVDMCSMIERADHWCDLRDDGDGGRHGSAPVFDLSCRSGERGWL
jgi:hypothetical protein